MKDKDKGLACISLCNCATWTGGGWRATGADHAAGARPVSHIGDDRRRRQGGALSFELWARGSLK